MPNQPSPDNLLQLCQWPNLDNRYSQALREAVDYIINRFQPIGIVASGSILRGNPDPASDFDIYVIHEGKFRVRVQKFFNNIPAEIFANTALSAEKFIDCEQTERQPITSHMMGTGFVILNNHPIMTELRNKAIERLGSPPPSPTPYQLMVDRYMTSSIYEDAVDVIERDPTTARMLLAKAMLPMLHYLFAEKGLHIPRPKDLLNAVAALNPEVGLLVESFYQAPDAATQLDLAGQIADRTIGVRGFFEWESEPVES